MAALATTVGAVLLSSPGLPASAASEYCDSTTPSTSILFYKKSTGEAGTGTLSAGQWQYKAALRLPGGYTHAAASRDSLLLYNAVTGAGESGTFTGGRYQRVQRYTNFSKGWTHMEASGDTLIAYNSRNGHGGTGTLKRGVYRHVRNYDDFSTNWRTVAASCDTASFANGAGVGYGTLTNGVYQHQGDRRQEPLGYLTATEDTVLSLDRNGSEMDARVAWQTGGDVGEFRDLGTTGLWEKTARTSDSIFFYKSDGTAWTSTLSGDEYENVGSLADVSSGWTLIEGGV